MDTSAFKAVRVNLTGLSPDEALKLLEKNYNLLLDAVQSLVVSLGHTGNLVVPKRDKLTKPEVEGELLYTGESFWLAVAQPNGVLFWAPILRNVADKGM